MNNLRLFGRKTNYFQTVATALLEKEFLYCGKVDEFYSDEDIQSWESFCGWKFCQAEYPENILDVCSEGELFTCSVLFLSYEEKLDKFKEILTQSQSLAVVPQKSIRRRRENTIQKNWLISTTRKSRRYY